MHIRMHGASELTLTSFDEPGFEVEHDEGVDAHYSALQMFATSLGLCTASVVGTYGERFDTAADDLAIRVEWSYADNPYRVDDIEMTIDWPSLPESRREAVRRAAEQCTIHNTLHDPPEVVTRVADNSGD